MAVAETESVTVSAGGGTKPSPYGRRLVANIIDETAAREPSRPFVFAPRSSRAEHGWTAITFGQVANATNYVARLVAQVLSKETTGSDDDCPTLAYVGPSDIRYLIVMLACIKARCCAFFISPRNSPEAQLELLDKTSCRCFWYAPEFAAIVQPWIGDRQMAVAAVATPQEWLCATAEPFPYNRSYDDGRFDPLVVLHTSGTTGIPKPIVVRQGSIAVADRLRNLPEFDGADSLWKFSASRVRNMFVPLPLFHAAGLSTTLTLAALDGTPVTLGMPDQRLSADLAKHCLAHAPVDSAMLPPSIVDEISRSEDGLQQLKALRLVAFCGGNLSSAGGARLLKHGVHLCNVIGSTEAFPYALRHQPCPELWQYFILNSARMGAHWICRDPHERIYEMTFRRKNLRDPGDQPVFYTFPDLRDWSTGDLFKAHPTLPDHWMYYGRADDVIVLSNGEKLNPVSMEDRLTGHPSIRGALVVGQDRFQPALILEPIVAPKNDEERNALLEVIWPLVEEANKQAVAHGRIVRQLVALSDPLIPFPRAPKGTIRRAVTVKAYREHIDKLYEHVDNVDDRDLVPLNFADLVALTRSVTDLLAAELDVSTPHPDADFFALGLDSLQVMRLSNILRASSSAAGVVLDPDMLAPRVIYSNPTPHLLGSYLFAAAKNPRHDGRAENEKELEIRTLKRLVGQYASHLPPPVSGKPDPLDDGQTVLLTGSTGSLGAHLLHQLCALPKVQKVIALNRGRDGSASRQSSINAARGLSTDFTKVDFLAADLSLADLGLGTAKYEQLLSSADRVIHNAWPVHFNMCVASFEPHIRGVRHLVDFAHRAAKRVPVIFLSSISTVAAWKSADLVPEHRLDDDALPDMGYGRSKLAASRILDAASSGSGVPTVSIRMGQIAGPRGPRGVWNKQELMPTLVASSLHLGVLPRDVGGHDEVDWLPVEDAAGLVLDLSGVTVKVAVSDLNGYFHGVNPSKTTWTKLAAALEEYYAARIKLVSFEEWVAALEASAAATTDLSKNPAVKLLDTYKGILRTSRAVRLDMRRTMRRSPTVAMLGPVTPELMKLWCSQWDY
ncbi:NRPS-like enzyme [Drechmeria coniospora]|uniref:NRPS-like enzyme n=1 Tax=Drechmeria coniospora TaxID=98403 RepID=A0A151GJ68_DRECN|nr:NRPS-like enzyme [Drechmeria coniospora]KYK57081.1 NRPS-like enzyme [Drechmeria coniospora]